MKIVHYLICITIFVVFSLIHLSTQDLLSAVINTTSVMTLATKSVQAATRILKNVSKTRVIMTH